MTRDDVPLGKGQCDIRLQVDNQVEVAVRRDFVNIRTIAGQDARDDGSECNLPLPDRDLQGFNFEVKDSRGDIRLIAEPSRRNDFTAVIAIRDGSSGFGRYHFRLSWMATGISDEPRRDEPRPMPPPPPTYDDRAPRRFEWSDVVHFSGPGRGSSRVSGFGDQPLFGVSVDIDRGGRVSVSFRTEGGRTLNFTGTVVGRDGDTLRADVEQDDRRFRMAGPMFLSVRGRMNDVYRISMDGSNGRDRMHLDWDLRQ